MGSLKPCIIRLVGTVRMSSLLTIYLQKVLNTITTEEKHKLLNINFTLKIPGAEMARVLA